MTSFICAFWRFWAITEKSARSRRCGKPRKILFWCYVVNIPLIRRYRLIDKRMPSTNFARRPPTVQAEKSEQTETHRLSVLEVALLAAPMAPAWDLQFD